MASDELVEVGCEYVTQTDDAVMVRVYVGTSKSSSSVWLPKSQIDDYSGFDDYEDLDRDDPISLFIPMWMAEEKGLV